MDYYIAAKDTALEAEEDDASDSATEPDEAA